MHTCLSDEFKFCEETWIFHPLVVKERIGFETCTILGYLTCWEKHHGLEEGPAEHLLCIRHCLKDRSDVEICFRECYETHFKKHSDAVYTQNP
jgi:hypothetical protein